MLNILFIGDVVGKPGRQLLRRHLDRIVDGEKIDFAVANAENAAGGFGITPDVAEELFGLGIHCLTSGNHIWDKREVYDYIRQQPALLRPLNYSAGCPGSGVWVGQTAAGVPVAVRVIVVDVHGEATSEKSAMGWHLAGRASMVLGTHTHVPTADERILEGGTAYLTDVGMTGPYDSIIGVLKEDILERFRTGLPVRFRTAKRGGELRAVVVGVEEETGRAVSIRRIAICEED